MRNRPGSVILALVCAVAVAGCASTDIFGFSVGEGDIAAGRQAFIAHRCIQCHTVAGEELPTPAGMSWPMLELGGATSILRSHADLTTSIINPNHSISEEYRDQLLLDADLEQTPMRTPDLDAMTVRQLIDIVAFLDSRYELQVEDYD